MSWADEAPVAGAWTPEDMTVSATLRYSELTTETYENQVWVYSFGEWDKESAGSGTWV